MRVIQDIGFRVILILPQTRRKESARVVLQDVNLSLAAALVDLFTVSAEIVPVGLDDRQVQLRYRFWLDVGMLTG